MTNIYYWWIENELLFLQTYWKKLRRVEEIQSRGTNTKNCSTHTFKMDQYEFVKTILFFNGISNYKRVRKVSTLDSQTCKSNKIIHDSYLLWWANNVLNVLNKHVKQLMDGREGY